MFLVLVDVSKYDSKNASVSIMEKEGKNIQALLIFEFVQHSFFWSLVLFIQIFHFKRF